MGIVYERLKELCDKRGISGYKMCKDIGLQPSTMTELKMDRKHSLSAKSLAKVSEYFGVPMSYIAGDTDELVFLNEDEKVYLSGVANGITGVGLPTTKGKLTITSDDFDELANLWNTLKDRPEMKVLFKSATCATKEQIEAVAQMLDSFKAKGKQWED